MLPQAVDWAIGALDVVDAGGSAGAALDKVNSQT